MENGVRPTRRCLGDLGLSFPDLTTPLSHIAHPLIQRAQRIPEEVGAAGAERVKSLHDLVWLKCKTSDHRGIVTRLTPEEMASRCLPPTFDWWLGAAGKRRADSATDFYKKIEDEALREGRHMGGPSTLHLLPQEIDSERLTAELAALAHHAIRKIVLELLARSLHDGHPYSAELAGHRVTALVRAASASEAYLAICAEGFLDPRVIALILDAVPGINNDDWQPEPGGVANIRPTPGQIIWSTIIPPKVQTEILARSGDVDD
jgi:hypothetical protein